MVIKDDNPKIRKKNKFGAYISFFGRTITYIIGNIYKRFKDDYK